MATVDLREPQIRKALFWILLLAAVLLTLIAGWDALIHTAFLAEFLSEGRWPLLSLITIEPTARPFPLKVGDRTIPADLYEGRALRSSTPLIVVHGLSPEGKDHPQLKTAARLLARRGGTVLVPTLPGLTRMRLRPEDAEPVVQAVEAMAREGHRGVALLGVSVGAGPALLAAADQRVALRVTATLTLGGYASAVELFRFFLTGVYRYGEVEGRVQPFKEAAYIFLRENLDLLKSPTDRRLLSQWLQHPGSPPPGGLSSEGAAVVRLVENREPARVETLLQDLTPELWSLIDALSPERVISKLRGRLFLVHGRDDPAVPFTESLRLAEAARGSVPTRLVILGAIAHVEPNHVRSGWGETTRELLQLWALTYDFFQTQ